jgi:hypothetical protein
MATKADYTVGANAAVPVIQSDFNTLVPSWARSMIPAGEAQRLAGAIAKAVIDAVDAARAKAKG